MAFKDRLILKTIVSGQGVSSEKEEGTPNLIWADVDIVGVTTQYAAESVGKKIEYTAIIWKHDYKNENYAEYKNTLYKIDSVGKTNNDLKIKLTLVG